MYCIEYQLLIIVLYACVRVRMDVYKKNEYIYIYICVCVRARAKKPSQLNNLSY